MDDFLHNLRTGKNKNFDRGRRNFDNPSYKGGDRPGKEKSKGAPAVQGLSPEVITALSVTLKDIAESFSRVSEAGEEMARLVLRQTQLLEQLVETVREKQQLPLAVVCAAQAGAISSKELQQVEKDKEDQRGALKQRIKSWHAEGLSFKKIAARLQAEGEATLSGKGLWHGRSVSRIVNEA